MIVCNEFTPRICDIANPNPTTVNIIRCLNSVKDFVDVISICDTGSTDNTPFGIEEWAKNNNVETKVYKSKISLIKSVEDIEKYIVKGLPNQYSLKKKIENSCLHLDQYKHELKESHLEVYNFIQNLFNINNLNEVSDVSDVSDVNLIEDHADIKWDTLDNNTKQKLYNKWHAHLMKMGKKCKEFIESFKKNIFYPENIDIDCKFKNFGFNRTQSIQLAKKAFPDIDLFFLLDADMELVVKENFNKNELTGNCYELYQVDKNIKYTNTRLVSPKLNWNSVCATHEYWTAVGMITQTLSDSKMYIYDHDDGGCKFEKHTRDYKLLLDEINDPRTIKSIRRRDCFYLAQTCYGINKFKECIKWGKKRIELEENHPSEAWMAVLYISRCYTALFKESCNKYNAMINKNNNINVKHIEEYENIIRLLDENKNYSKDEILINNEKLINKYSEKCKQIKFSSEKFKILEEEKDDYFSKSLYYIEVAYNMRPFRMEALFEKAKLYRDLGKNQNAYMISKFIIDNINMFDKGLDDRLFVQYKEYEYMPYQELSITAYYVAQIYTTYGDYKQAKVILQEGLKACNVLLGLDNSIYPDKQSVLNSKSYYDKELIKYKNY